MQATSSSAPDSAESQAYSDPILQENVEDFYEIDFTKELNIPRGVENVDELVMLTKKYVQDPDTHKDSFIKNLYEMIGYLSYEDVTTRGQMTRLDQFQYAAKNFNEALNSLKQLQWVQERILNHLTPPNDWPQDLYDYLDNNKNGMRARVPNKSFLAKFPRVNALSEDDQKAIAFGYKLASSYATAKHTINTIFNRLWKNPEDLESGQTFTALCRVIREALWYPDAKKRALTSWYTKVSRLKRTMSEDEIATVHANKENDIREKMDQLLTTYTIDWYPIYWFIFIAFGKPADPGKRLTSDIEVTDTPINSLPMMELVGETEREEVDLTKDDNDHICFDANECIYMLCGAQQMRICWSKCNKSMQWSNTCNKDLQKSL